MKTKFYESLKKMRTDMHYTQAQMADELEIPRSTYSNYESGKRSPDLDTLLKISQTLNCSLDELFGINHIPRASVVREDTAPYKTDMVKPHRKRKIRSKEKGLGIGVWDFRKLREHNNYYVDKTELIQEFLDSNTEVTLITRPRRFGKTLNMSMIAEFLDYTKDSKELFKGTKIGGTEYMEDCNQYPVVFLSYLNAKGDTEEELLTRIYDVIRQEYNRYDALFESDRLSDARKEELRDIYEGLRCEKSSPIESKSITATAIMKLCQALKEYYGANVYLLIDEYDTPFISANAGGYYDKLRTFLSVMLSSALKGNNALEKAMLTGTQRVAKENIFSGLNNLAVCTVKDSEYAGYFGFTKTETAEVLKYYGLELTDEVRQMYDGYLFGHTEMYNPWSIMYYASRKELEPYWVNTSENSMIEHAMDDCGEIFQKDYQRLLEAGKVSVTAELENSFFENPGEDALWGMLINAGMVAVREKIEKNYYTVCIPNKEVAQAFQELTAHSLQVKDGQMMRMMYALKTGDMETFSEAYKRILLNLPSYHDLKDENSYHMMMLGMCAYLYGDYEVKSNRESGHGRSDIILNPLRKERAGAVLEFKYTKDEGQNLHNLAIDALEQIQEKDYDVEIEGCIYHIGLAHYGKNAEVVWTKKHTDDRR